MSGFTGIDRSTGSVCAYGPDVAPADLLESASGCLLCLLPGEDFRGIQSDETVTTGVNGFGIGSALCDIGRDVTDVSRRAQAFAQARAAWPQGNKT